jgi:hypothetical protein
MRKYLIIADVHLESGVQEDLSYLTIKNLIAKEKFDGIYINGDFLDLSYISRWTADSPLLVEGKRLKADLDLLDVELKYMRKYAKEITFLSGNHCDRLNKMVEAIPVLEGLISIEEICRDNKVTHIPTVNQPHKIFDDLYISHGLSLNKYAAANNVEKSGVSMITSHSHRTQQYTTSYLNQVAITGYSIGCISSLNPDYVAGKRISGWSQSFAILNCEPGLWDIQIYMLKNHKCIVNGKVYGPDR